MANEQNLKPFKKGNNANPLGARAHDPIKKMLKKLTVAELEDIIKASSCNTMDELQSIVKDKSSSAIKVAVAMCLVKAMNKGDWGTIEKMMDRGLGKIVQKIDHTSGGEKMNSLPQIQIMLPPKNE